MTLIEAAMKFVKILPVTGSREGWKSINTTDNPEYGDLHKAYFDQDHNHDNGCLLKLVKPFVLTPNGELRNHASLYSLDPEVVALRDFLHNPLNLSPAEFQLQKVAPTSFVEEMECLFAMASTNFYTTNRVID